MELMETLDPGGMAGASVEIRRGPLRLREMGYCPVAGVALAHAVTVNLL
jgi:hypothetical protein